MVYAAILIEQKTMNGVPVFNGTSVPVHVLFEYVEKGKNMQQFLSDHPTVTTKMAVDVLHMAKLAMTTERILQENFQGE
jgi:uncharacterized protein (DUF433 family)